MATTFPFPVLWSGGVTWADADPQPADIEGIAHWHDTSIDTHLDQAQTTKPTLKVAVDGILLMNQLQNASWRMGRRGWFSKLEVGSGTFSFIGLVDAEPSDDVVVYCETDVLWAGTVENTVSTRNADGIWYSTIDAVDVLGRLGKTELVDYHPGDLRGWTYNTVSYPQNLIIYALEQHRVNRTAATAYTTAAATNYTAYRDSDFTGDLLGFLNRQEELGNIVLTQTRSGNIKYLVRQPSASYVLPVIPLTGGDSPSGWSERISSADTVNRWYSENESGDVYVDFIDEAAAESRGARDVTFDGPLYWSVTGDGQWPIGLFETLVDPRPVLDEGAFHITTLQQGVLMLEPLDVVEHNDELWSVMTVQHEVSLDDWVVKIIAERSNNYITGVDEFGYEYPTPPTYSLDSQTIDVSEDSHVNNVDSASSGSLHYLIAGLEKSGGVSRRYRANLYFPITWPAGFVAVQSAKLKLENYGLSGSSPKVEVRRIAEDWTPSALYSWPGPSTTSDGATVKAVAGDSYTFDITDIAQGWHDHGNNGLHIRSVNEASVDRTIVVVSEEGDPASGTMPYIELTCLVETP